MYPCNCVFIAFILSFLLPCLCNAKDHLLGRSLHPFVQSYLIQPHLLANWVAHVGAEELANPHIAHVGASKPSIANKYISKM